MKAILPSRRAFLRSGTVIRSGPFTLRLIAAILALVCASPHMLRADDVLKPGLPAIDIDSRRELFVDDFLIDRLAGSAATRLHHPEPREVALVHDAPWEGNKSGYHSIFKDGDLYRLYYRGQQIDFKSGKLRLSHSPQLCYAESRDGIHWTRPELGLVEFNGSTANNIVLANGKLGSLDFVVSEFAIFKDQNPACPADARYKALIIAVNRKVPDLQRGLLAFKSADGLRWTPMSDKQVITKDRFDSQNVAFWDATRGEYRAYYRYVTAEDADRSDDNLVGRGIKTATFKDFLNWSEGVPLEYPGKTEVQLYTNVIQPYYRAPHLFVGFPKRYLQRDWSDSLRALPDLENRQLRAGAMARLGTALTETLLMTSRDGLTFNRWEEAFLRPGIERPGTWSYGQTGVAWQLVETRSVLEGAPNELSLYAGEHSWTGKGAVLRRYTLRLDGFASVNAPMSGGELVTKPLTFRGNKLTLNFSTSAAGSVQVEIQDEAGKPLPGFALEDCQTVFGDSLERMVTWKNGGDVSALAGQPVRLRFVMKDADLFALQFRP